MKLGLAVVLFASALAACSKDAPPNYSAWVCGDLTESVEQGSRGEYMEARNLRDLKIAVDNRHDYAAPTEGYGMVLRCTGQARWNWGRGAIVVELVADAAGDTRVTWEPGY